MQFKAVKVSTNAKDRDLSLLVEKKVKEMLSEYKKKEIIKLDVQVLPGIEQSAFISIQYE